MYRCICTGNANTWNIDICICVLLCICVLGRALIQFYYLSYSTVFKASIMPLPEPLAHCSTVILLICIHPILLVNSSTGEYLKLLPHTTQAKMKVNIARAAFYLEGNFSRVGGLRLYGWVVRHHPPPHESHWQRLPLRNARVFPT